MTATKRGHGPTRRCSKCGEVKPNTVEHFQQRYDARNKGKPSTLDSWCRPCKRAVRKAWGERNVARVKAQKQADRLTDRVTVLRHYSGSQVPACACCGEAHLEFLAIDHMAGGGRAHTKAIKRVGGAFYRWLIVERFPEGFQVLCHNCNMAKGFYGACPHQVEGADRRHELLITTGRQQIVTVKERLAPGLAVISWYGDEGPWELGQVRTRGTTCAVTGQPIATGSMAYRPASKRGMYRSQRISVEAVESGLNHGTGHAPEEWQRKATPPRSGSARPSRHPRRPPTHPPVSVHETQAQRRDEP